MVALAMIGLTAHLPPRLTVPRHLCVPAGLAMGGVVLVLSLTQPAEAFLTRVLLFYAATSLAYGLMPYVRRADIPLVAAWVVLLSALAPCLTGQLISPLHVTADSLGVLMSAAPVFIARFRQVQQGDVRPAGRRAAEH